MKWEYSWEDLKRDMKQRPILYPFIGLYESFMDIRRGG